MFYVMDTKKFFKCTGHFLIVMMVKMLDNDLGHRESLRRCIYISSFYVYTLQHFLPSDTSVTQILY